MKRKHNVNQEIVNTLSENCVIGLKKLNKAIVTGKILNLKFLAFSRSKLEYMEFFRKSKYFRYLKQDLKKENIEVVTLEPNKLVVQYFFQSVDITPNSTSKSI